MLRRNKIKIPSTALNESYHDQFQSLVGNSQLGLPKGRRDEKDSTAKITGTEADENPVSGNIDASDGTTEVTCTQNSTNYSKQNVASSAGVGSTILRSSCSIQGQKHNKVSRLSQNSPSFGTSVVAESEARRSRLRPYSLNKFLKQIKKIKCASTTKHTATGWAAKIYSEVPNPVVT